MRRHDLSGIGSLLTRGACQSRLPLRLAPGGLLLDRLVGLIFQADRSVFDVSIPNANVWFELGIAVARQRPLRVLADVKVSELADILRGAWLDTYEGDEGCATTVNRFLAEPTPEATITVQLHGADPDRTIVFGLGAEVSDLADHLEARGRNVSLLATPAIADFQSAFDAASDAAAVVLALPGGPDPWVDHSAAGAWITLGIARGLGRIVTVAAGRSSAVPSDCPALVARGDDVGTLAEAELATLERAAIHPPPLWRRCPASWCPSATYLYRRRNADALGGTCRRIHCGAWFRQDCKRHPGFETGGAVYCGGVGFLDSYGLT
jgi:hypothetical protein